MKGDRTFLTVTVAMLALGLIEGHALGAQVSVGEFIASATTIVVSPKETPAASGAALLKAIDGIVDASENKPYLVSVMPGVYDLGNETLDMKSYVSLRGAGVMETKIIGNGEVSEGMLLMIDKLTNVHVSQLTVKHESGSAQYTIGIRESSPYIQNVWALNSGESNEKVAVFVKDASPVMDEMRCIASGQGAANVGVYNWGGSPNLRNIYAEGSGGAANFGIMNSGGTPVIRFSTAVAKGGDEAVGVLNEQKSAPQLVHVGVTASDAIDNAGIRNVSSSNAIISDLSVTVKGGERTKGIQTVESSTARIKNVSISASGGTVRNYGVFVDSADAYMERMWINVQGAGAAEDYGVGVQNTSTVRLNHSTVSAATHSVQAGGTGADLDLGCTVLYGGPAVGVSFTPCN